MLILNKHALSVVEGSNNYVSTLINNNLIREGYLWIWRYILYILSYILHIQFVIHYTNHLMKCRAYFKKISVRRHPLFVVRAEYCALCAVSNQCRKASCGWSFSFFPLPFLLDKERVSIIEHSGHDSSEAATSLFVLCWFIPGGLGCYTETIWK